MDFSFSFLLFFLFFWWEELRDFVLVNFFFLKTMKEKMLHWPTANIPIKFSLAMTKHNTCRAKGFYGFPLFPLQRKKMSVGSK